MLCTYARTACLLYANRAEFVHFEQAGLGFGIFYEICKPKVRNKNPPAPECQSTSYRNIPRGLLSGCFSINHTNIFLNNLMNDIFRFKQFVFGQQSNGSSIDCNRSTTPPNRMIYLSRRFFCPTHGPPIVAQISHVSQPRANAQLYRSPFICRRSFGGRRCGR